MFIVNARLLFEEELPVMQQRQAEEDLHAPLLATRVPRPPELFELRDA